MSEQEKTPGSKDTPDTTDTPESANDTPAQANDESAKEEELSNWPFIKRVFISAAVLILLVYAAWWTALYSIQDSLIFPTDGLPPVSGELRYPNTQVLEIQQPTGELSRAWLVMNEKASADNPMPLVVFFHGNQELIDYQDDIVGIYVGLGCSVLLPEYRGYGHSGGSPSRDGIVSDAVNFVIQAVDRPDVDQTRVVFHGRSLGGAVAAETATQGAPAAMILQSTFTSAADMGKQFAAPGFLIKHKFDTRAALRKLACPVLIFHGSQDEIVPVHHAHALREAARNSAYVEYDADHNSFPGEKNGPAYVATIVSFLMEVGIVEKPGSKKKQTKSTDSEASATQPSTQPAESPATQPVAE